LVSELPSFVDSVVVVDDTCAASLLEFKPELERAARAGLRVHLLQHPSPLGLGRAVVTGYRAMLAEGLALCVVAWPTEPLDPTELYALLRPVAERVADLATGSRLQGLPSSRSAGNRHKRGIFGGLEWWGVGRRGRDRLSARLWGRVFRGEGELDLGCPHHAISTVALRRLPLNNLERGSALAVDLLRLCSKLGLVIQGVELRPLTTPRNKSAIEAASLFRLLGRLVFRELRQQSPKLMPETTRAQARVASARLVNPEIKQRKLPQLS